MTHGPTTLVTGAAYGIGAAVAADLARRGHRLALTAEVPIADAPPGASTHVADLTIPSACEDVVRAAAAAHGGLANLVLVAGATRLAPIAELTPQDVDHLLALNLRAPWLLVRAALEHLVAAGGGSVVLLSSTMAQRPIAGCSAYAGTKAGVEGLARALAVELAEHGIRVNAVAPGLTRVPRMEGQPWFTALDDDRVPAAFNEPSAVAAAVAVLLDDAMDRVSGTVLPIDGAAVLSAAPAPPPPRRWGRLRR